MNDLPEWAEGIDPGSIKKAVNAGEILPNLALPSVAEGKTTSDETLFVKWLKNQSTRKILGIIIITCVLATAIQYCQLIANSLIAEISVQHQPDVPAGITHVVYCY